LRLNREKLLRARELLGYGIEKVAEEAGVSKNSVLRAEHEGDIRPLTARRIAAALKVEVADLVTVTDDAKKEEALAASQPSLDDALEVDRRFQISQLRQLDQWKIYLEGCAERWQELARHPESFATGEAAAGAGVEANRHGIYIFRTIRSRLIPTIQDQLPEEIARVQMAEFEALINRLNDALDSVVAIAGQAYAAETAARKEAQQEHMATVTDIRERLSA
jgi:transcriptional regulator with XRE-family HTH domain